MAPAPPRGFTVPAALPWTGPGTSTSRSPTTTPSASRSVRPWNDVELAVVEDGRHLGRRGDHDRRGRWDVGQRRWIDAMNAECLTAKYGLYVYSAVCFISDTRFSSVVEGDTMVRTDRRRPYVLLLAAIALSACGKIPQSESRRGIESNSLTSASGTLAIFAGVPSGAGSIDGTGSAARFYYPSGVAVDGSGNVYVADMWNSTIRKVTPAGAVTTLAGSAGVSGSADGIGSASRFYYPSDVAVDGSGNVYVADSSSSTIRKVTPAGVVTTLAGSAGVSGSADGTGSAARFSYPESVAVDGSGNVYVADTYNYTIRKVTPAGVVTTLAGSAGVRGSADGTGSAARFYDPQGVAVDRSGNIYVADSGNSTIRKITPAGEVTTLAGLAGSFGSDD